MKRQYVRDGQPVKKTLVAEFPGEDYNEERVDDMLHIHWQSPDVDGAIRLVTSFDGTSYIAEKEGDTLCVYIMTTEPLTTSTVGDSRGGVVLGRPGPKVAAAMRSGKTMSAERLQALNEAARRGEKPTTIKDRTPNPRAVAMQRAGEKLRGEWK